MTTAGHLAPLVEAGPELSRAELERYARHLALPGVGSLGQRRLANARVLVVGAGGLGSPALLYLAAAGVGTIGIVDDDDVDTSNLQRQVIHGGSDVGRAKVDSARDAIAEINPHVRVVAHRTRLDAENALEILGGYDLVLDGADNFPTRYLVSDAAEVLGIPVVWGSIYRFQGQVAVFWARPRGTAGTDTGTGTDAGAGTDEGPGGVTYRDVFPVPPPPGAAPDCATGGVFGAMCGTLGSVMATEAIKLVTGAGTTLLGRLAVYDALDLTWRQLTVRRDPTRTPVTELLTGDQAYAAFCGLAPPSAQTAPTAPTAEDRKTAGGDHAPSGTNVRDSIMSSTTDSVTIEEMTGLLAAHERGEARVELLDVREDWEARIQPVDGARLVPSGVFLDGGADAEQALAALPTDAPVLVLCASGMRSARVVEVARAAGVDARNVEGGVRAWSAMSLAR